MKRAIVGIIELNKLVRDLSRVGIIEQYWDVCMTNVIWYANRFKVGVQLGGALALLE